MATSVIHKSLQKSIEMPRSTVRQTLKMHGFIQSYDGSARMAKVRVWHTVSGHERRRMEARKTTEITGRFPPLSQPLGKILRKYSFSCIFLVLFPVIFFHSHEPAVILKTQTRVLCDGACVCVCVLIWYFWGP